MGRLLTPDRLAQDPDGAILEDVDDQGRLDQLGRALADAACAGAGRGACRCPGLSRRDTKSATSPWASARSANIGRPCISIVLVQTIMCTALLMPEPAPDTVTVS